jgi:hypothetical protein
MAMLMQVRLALRQHRRTLIEVLATLLVSSASAMIVLWPSLQALNAPWGASDMTQYYFAADLWQGLSSAATEDFGFPNGMDPTVYSGLDVIQYDFARIVNLLSGSPFVGLNLLLVISFPLVAVLAYAAIRLVGLRGPLAVALGTAFTFIPFHFGRGIGHVDLATLFGAVAGLILVLLIGSGRIQWWAAQSRGWVQIRYVALVGLLVVTSAWSGLYYAAFTVIFLVAATIWRAAQGDSVRRLLVPLLSIAGVAVVSAIGLLPVLLSRAGEAGAAAVGLRDPMDSVTLAGNLAVAIVPQPYNIWFPAYNDFIWEMFQGPGASDEPRLMSNFGTWITTACLIVMLVGLVGISRRMAHRRDLTPIGASSAGEAPQPPRASLSYITYLLMVLLLFFMPWGLNFFSAYFVTAQIRAWNRLVPLLLLLFILGAASVLSTTRLARNARWSMAVAALVIAVTVIEMILPWRNLYSWAADNGRTRIDEAYAYAYDVNRAIPERCGVLTLPLMLYPNNGPVMPAMDDYDHLLIGLTNPEKPISYGAMRDTPASNWQLDYVGVPTREQVRELTYMGFCAVHVDTFGYEDPASILVPMEATLGAPVAVSGNGRWEMFSLK